jgi:Protein of unknown function (DUF2478)
MPNSQNRLAALVYGAQDKPDDLLRGFASDLVSRGLRVVGMVQAGQCADSSLSAVLLPSGERLLLAQDFDPDAKGCRLDVSRLQNAGKRVAEAMEPGADLLIINRFGKRERDGNGLGYLIERAVGAGIPVVVGVSSERFADWVNVAGCVSAKLDCNRDALAEWWNQTRVHELRP